MEGNDFCTALTIARNNAGLSKAQLARRIPCSPGLITKWEQGKHLPSWDNVARLDEVLGARNQLVHLWQVAMTGSLLKPWEDSIPELEQGSHTIELGSPWVIPGLLQCPAYMALMLREGRFPETEVEIKREVSTRSGRYDALAKNGSPWVTAVFPLGALACLPDDVRRDQVEHLLKLISGGRVEAHLIPDRTVIGLVSPMSVFRLRDGRVVTASEHNRGVVIHSDPTGVERMTTRFTRVLGSALPPRESVEKMKEIMA
ncbi:helix-turn-helix domain-containing protein [Nocardiopsis lucentensis]|uniref:helix-turn-helix domain-containing protein n=1 Tax=Nocardiopsis lucentensis TaxID=53441 RepID=UPI0009FC820D|nr:helix-turn-helix transcriptional regulator [Nocardiopsis lucentensis]